MTRTGAIRIVVAYPLLAQPQADGGNALVLAERCWRRGLAAEVDVHHGPGRLPAAELYVLGGVEDENHAELARQLRAGGLPAAVAAGAGVLAVDAGYQVVGRGFDDPDGRPHEGLGLLDIVSARSEAEAQGPIVSHPNPSLGLPALSGFESHHGRTVVGSGAAPLCALELGVGNGDAERTDGAVQGRVIGTYLHGPVLARNPALADLLLGWVVDAPLDPIDDGRADRLRWQRIAEDRADPTGWGGLRYGRTSRLEGRRARARS